MITNAFDCIEQRWLIVCSYVLSSLLSTLTRGREGMVNEEEEEEEDMVRERGERGERGRGRREEDEGEVRERR